MGGRLAALGRGSTRRRRRDIVGIGLCLASAGALVWAITVAETLGTAADFTSYRINADRWLAGGSLLPEDQLDTSFVLAFNSGHVYYPPPGMLMLIPITRIGYEAFTVLGSVLLYVGLLRIVSRDHRVTAAWAGAIGLLAFTPQCLNAIMLGNVGILIAAAVAWAYRGGAVFPAILGAMFKVTPMAIAGLGGARGIGMALIGAGLVVGGTLPIVGVGSWSDFLSALGNASPYCDSAVSVACLTGSTTAALLVGVLLVVPCLWVTSPLIRLALVTGSVLATTMELGVFSGAWLLASPLTVALLAAVLARRSAAAAKTTLPNSIELTEERDFVPVQIVR